MTDTDRMITVYDLPETYRYYSIELTSRDSILVSGTEKEKILSTGTNFVALKSGEVLNKLHIISILLNKIETMDKFKKLSDEMQKKILEEALSKQAKQIE